MKKTTYKPASGSELEGPNGFICWLGEPEDRIWYRDLKPVVDELNRLTGANNALLKVCRKIIDDAKKATSPSARQPFYDELKAAVALSKSS